jgi:arylformamidase
VQSLFAQGVFATEAVEGFGFETIRDVPYVPAKLDQEVQSSQTLDIYKPEGGRKLPVVLYVHGGGWAFGSKNDVNLKPHYFTSKGFAFLSMNYRLRWDYKIYDQIVDVIAAVRWIESEGNEHGLDSSRIVLMGHQAGGHLVTLAAADRSFLEAEGMTGANIKAVVSVDSSSYDITRLMRELGSFVERRQHQLIFGNDENVWQAASPITHVDENRGIPPIALLYNPKMEASSLQAKGFAKELSRASVDVIMIPGSVDAPDRTDELLGSAGNVSTVALMAFLRSQI